MAEKIADMFEGEPKEEPKAAVAEVKAEVPPQAVTRPAALTPEPPKPAVVEPPRAEPVPIAALLDERDKRQRAEKERDELRARIQKPQQVPSVHDDPEAAFAYQQEQTQRALTSARFDISETMATDKHGVDTVKAAMDWGMQRSQESPAFAAEYIKQKHPIDWAVRQHKRELRNAEIGDDFDAYVEREAAKRGWTKAPAAPQVPGTQPAQAAPQPVVQPATPRPSLVSAPSAGGLQTPVVPKHPVLDRLGLGD